MVQGAVLSVWKDKMLMFFGCVSEPLAGVLTLLAWSKKLSLGAWRDIWNQFGGKSFSLLMGMCMHMQMHAH